MNENEIIIYECENEFLDLSIESLKYAILSIPFTINRMSLSNIIRRIENIFKGKIAEKVFYKYAEENNIEVNVEKCETPFYKIDKRDFIWKGFEWDIKNNYLHHESDLLNRSEYLELPALVPNRHSGDQWCKREEKLHAETSGVRFIFTFMKLDDLVNGKRKNKFYKINLEENILKKLRKLVGKYKGLPTENKPFEEKQYFDYLEIKNMVELINIHYKPKLIITAYAGEEEFNNFCNVYKTSFLKGTLNTIIRNKYRLIEELPSFIDLVNRGD